jgi:hypothetical protein
LLIKYAKEGLQRLHSEFLLPFQLPLGTAAADVVLTAPNPAKTSPFAVGAARRRRHAGPRKRLFANCDFLHIWPRPGRFILPLSTHQ